MKDKYKIGDTVEITSQSDTHYGLTARIIDISNEGENLLIEFPDRHPDCHDGEGKGKSQRCWHLHAGDIKKVTFSIKKKKVTLESVILPKEKKEEVRAAMAQTKYLELIFKEWGFEDTFEKGIAITMLFYGIPGTGKTLMAQAVADELGSEIKLVGPAEIETAEPGGAERNIQMLFANTKGKNTILCFDECDSLLADRNEVGTIIAGQINTLLSEIERYDGVVIFTTNRLGKLDPALERRICAKIEFPFPDVKARAEIWKRIIPKKCPLAKDVSYKKLAEFPICGGNIKNAILNAARMAAYKKDTELKLEYFVQAIENEAKSIAAFVAEYEGNVHQHNLGKKLVRSSTGVSIGKDQVKLKERATELLREIKKKKGGHHAKHK